MKGYSGVCHRRLSDSLDGHWSLRLVLALTTSRLMNDNEIITSLTNGGPTYLEMNEAFCARLRAAIAAGLESAPIGVVTTPGTKNPKYVATELRPLVSSQRDLEHA